MEDEHLLPRWGFLFETDPPAVCVLMPGISIRVCPIYWTQKERAKEGSDWLLARLGWTASAQGRQTILPPCRPVYLNLRDNGMARVVKNRKDVGRCATQEMTCSTVEACKCG